MSINDTEERRDFRSRRTALLVLGLMTIIFIILSAFSFLPSRNQVLPETVEYAGMFEAIEGKRVFQAYNCMGCHTIVGNGGYFGPDITNTFDIAGPAWLAAFIPSAASWPTEAAVRVQLATPEVIAEIGEMSIEEYYERYPGAYERVHRRGGLDTLMPNLTFREGEVSEIIAFFKYTAEMDNAGWPPVPKVNGLEHPLATPLVVASTAPVSAGVETGGAEALPEPDLDGEAIATSTGCLACHSTGTNAVVGPGWGGLYNRTVTLSDGSTVVADEDYLYESIVDPNAKIVDGFASGLMPPYGAVLSDEEIAAIITFIATLEGAQ